MSALLGTLLNLRDSATKPAPDAWQLRPSADNFRVGSNLPESILMRTIDPIPAEALLSRTQTVHPILRTLFLQDLTSSGFPGCSFAWDYPWDEHWNQLFSRFVLKHWWNAYRAGVFKVFFIDPADTSNTSILRGLLHCWFIGRQEGIWLGRFSPQRKLKKKHSESKLKMRNQIQQHRRQTLSTLPVLPAVKTLFDNIKTTSDTEDTSSQTLVKVPLPWRSDEFTQFAQKLDTIYAHKKITTNGRTFVHAFILESKRSTSAPLSPLNIKNVPQKLPANCYSKKYWSTLSDSDKQLLNPRDPIEWPSLQTIV
ncbi:hypothetical protein PTTG_03584 [Puccinia triticina 1-1 BBBD Race 1]|uniref:Uncharacterized protein n=1 Tax=Puccinia triticina (isolate 1-1 / race 1 (BBBD)) TaxID=630390 RepID=A0A180GHB3_PUCT1|nr:hypothetical protein PTTG_03584 [Puccinia triticina 1-1 BBBD Race 1]